MSDASTPRVKPYRLDPTHSTVDVRGWAPELPDVIVKNGITSIWITGSDLSSLDHFTPVADRITRLSIRVAIPDLRAVSQFVRLEDLGMRGDIVDIDFARLPRLRKLAIQSKRASFGGLSAASGLEVLDISNCGLGTLEELPTLPALRELRVSEGPLKSLAGLDRQVNLDLLSLSLAPLRRLEGIEQLRRLTRLTLMMLGRLESVREVAALRTLRDLAIGSIRKAQDIAAIGELTQLDDFYAIGVSLGDLGWLAALTNLRALTFERVGTLPSIAFLQNMRRLERFALVEASGVADGDMSVLTCLPSLKKVFYTDRKHYRPKKDAVLAAIESRTS